MTHLFLTSKFHHVAHDIAGKLSVAQKQNIVFIDTAIKYRIFKEGELDWHYANHQAMQENGMQFELYDIRGKSREALEQDLAKYQVMYVEGGNSAYLLQEAGRSGFGEYVRERLDNGMVYLSESAGSVCAGADIAANSRPGKSAKDYDLPSTRGFGFVNFAILPHWGQESKKDVYLTHKIPQSYNTDFAYLPLTNNQYVEVQDDWFNIVDVTSTAT